jgi:acetyl-CoA carboxylase biotin carboxyl carrier protein
MEMDQQLMRALLDAFERSDWQEMTVTIGSDRLHVSRRDEPNGDFGAPPAPAQLPPGPAPEAQPAPPAAPAAPVQAAGSEQGHAEQIHGTATSPTGTVVESPSVGLFWRAPSPNSPPFVEVGARVAPGDTLAIVEVMKLMSHVVAPVGGVVKAILAENGTTVEYGQPIVVIDPEA